MASFVEERALALLSRPAEVAREDAPAAAPRRPDGAQPRKIGEGLYQPLADINVTPLVDVMLVLLIIFMVTAPMLATGIEVNLPSAKTAQPLENKEPVVVAVAKDGAFRSEKTPCRMMSWRGRSKPNLATQRVVQLRGDRDAAYGDVVSVMDELAANGISRITIVSSPPYRRADPSRASCPDTGRARRACPRRAQRADAVTFATLDGRVFEPPPLRPPSLRPLVILLVIALHAAALFFVSLTPKTHEPAGEVIVDIQPEAPPDNPVAGRGAKPPEQSAPPPAQDARQRRPRRRL